MMRGWLLALALFSPVSLGADVGDSRASELAKLRREVETLSSEVVLEKEDLRARLKAIEAQKLEIEVQIRREELRLAQVEGEAETRRAELAAHTESSGTLKPALTDAIAAIRGTVAAGLPFRLADRLAELDALQDQLDRGLVTPEAAVARLWAFTEDEMRMSRENGMDRQVVPLPDGEVLADVARLGMVALYFRTPSGVTGAATKTGETWTWRVFESRDDSKAVELLFEKLHHGVRTGAFTLPNPLVSP